MRGLRKSCPTFSVLRLQLVGAKVVSWSAYSDDMDTLDENNQATLRFAYALVSQMHGSDSTARELHLRTRM